MVLRKLAGADAYRDSFHALSPAAADAAFEDAPFWRYERDARVRGLGQLKDLRERALGKRDCALFDPVFAMTEALRLGAEGEDVDGTSFTDEHGAVPGDFRVVVGMVARYYEGRAGYYTAVIRDYRRELATALHQLRTIGRGQQRCAYQQVSVVRLPAPRARESRPRVMPSRGSRRLSTRSSASSDDDGLADLHLRFEHQLVRVLAEADEIARRAAS